MEGSHSEGLRASKCAGFSFNVSSAAAFPDVLDQNCPAVIDLFFFLGDYSEQVNLHFSAAAIAIHAHGPASACFDVFQTTGDLQ